MTEIGWSLDRSVWSAIADEATKENWRRVNFDYSARNLVEKAPGIYMLSLKAALIANVLPFTSLATPIYVGQSRNLRNRFCDHTNGRGDNALWRRVGDLKRQTEFWFLILPGKCTDDLKIIEQSLIDAFGKKLNVINSIAIGPSMQARFLTGGKTHA